MKITRIDSNARMSKIVVHGETVYLCGQTAGSVDKDISEQTIECLEKVSTLLDQAGSSVNKILSVTVYIKDMKEFEKMNRVWDSWFENKPKPARACVQAMMARDIVLVEMSVIAAL